MVTLLTKAECDRRRSAYTSTGSDAEAALLLGVSVESFCYWRTKEHLPSQFSIRVEAAKTAIRRFHEPGMTAGALADATGLRPAQCEAICRQLGLPLAKASAPSDAVPAILNALELYLTHQDEREAGSQYIGKTITTNNQTRIKFFRHFMMKHGLPPINADDDAKADAVDALMSKLEQNGTLIAGVCPRNGNLPGAVLKLAPAVA